MLDMDRLIGSISAANQTNVNTEMLRAIHHNVTSIAAVSDDSGLDMIRILSELLIASDIDTKRKLHAILWKLLPMIQNASDPVTFDMVAEILSRA